ncbi:2TM domain-containing protein [Actinokineospora fastidiosa]|uniref:2TM domain-containing protein n=1 Tax=Actinokineospora fastidiosa TaxID=1816 RepID=A0A918GBK2_9PSEU|nr:2TM domain-containing protein [Actinokineospora fastidiosa]GGS28723.1 hypothetical protein GCM10010171_22310 [Actinokineospora fastidiosa]
MADTTDPREEARKRVKNRRDFGPHLLMYLATNAMLVVIWLSTTAPGFFWPGIPMAAWGIGVLAHAWDAFFAKPISEGDVDRELNRWHRLPGSR